MYERRDLKAELKNCLTLALMSIGLALGGAVMLVVSTAFGRVYPVMALLSGGMILFGGLGVVVALLKAVFWLVKLRSGGSGRAPGRPIYGAGYAPRQQRTPPTVSQFDALRMLAQEQEAASEAARSRSDNPSPVTPPPPPRPAPPAQPIPPLPSQQMPPVQQAPAYRQPDRTPPPGPTTPPSPGTPSQPVPPRPPVPSDERPTTIYRRPSAEHRPNVDDTASTPFEYVAPSEDYSKWTTEALLERVRELDSMAMGMALHMGGVPDGMTQELNAVNAELSRRPSAG